MTGDVTSRQIVPKSPACPEGLFLMDGIEGLRSLPKHSVDMLLTDPPYGTTRNFWDVPLPLPELWEAVKWAVKPDGAVLFFAQCPYDKVLGASNLSMLRYEWVWYKSRCTGFLNARRAPLKRTENILVFYQKLPYYDPQFEQGKPYKKISRTGDNSPNYGKFLRSSSGSEDGLRVSDIHARKNFLKTRRYWITWIVRNQAQTNAVFRQLITVFRVPVTAGCPLASPGIAAVLVMGRMMLTKCLLLPFLRPGRIYRRRRLGGHQAEAQGCRH